MPLYESPDQPGALLERAGLGADGGLAEEEACCDCQEKLADCCCPEFEQECCIEFDVVATGAINGTAVLTCQPVGANCAEYGGLFTSNGITACDAEFDGSDIILRCEPPFPPGSVTVQFNGNGASCAAGAATVLGVDCGPPIVVTADVVITQILPDCPCVGQTIQLTLTSRRIPDCVPIPDPGPAAAIVPRPLFKEGLPSELADEVTKWQQGQDPS